MAARTEEEDVSAFLPPTPQAVLGYYLLRLVAGEAIDPAVADFIHEADVYHCAPGALAARFLPTPGADDRFFFSSVQRRCFRLMDRETGFFQYKLGSIAGSWSTQAHDREDVLDEDAGSMWRRRYMLRYGVPTDWLMDEYHLLCYPSEMEAAGVGD